MKKGRRMVFDKELPENWVEQPLPLSGKPLDFSCGNCGSKELVPIAELLQLGFPVNFHTFFIICDNCGTGYCMDAMSMNEAFVEDGE